MKIHRHGGTRECQEEQPTVEKTPYQTKLLNPLTLVVRGITNYQLFFFLTNDKDVNYKILISNLSCRLQPKIINGIFTRKFEMKLYFELALLLSF